MITSQQDFPPSDLSSAEVIKQAKEWIKTCLDDHTEGPQRQGDPFLPARLVNVQTLQLKLTHPTERSTYAALSYCWVTEQYFVTLLSNIDSLTDKINWALLPVTIQDAILTTRNLGITWLWVDALCIIQDSPKDKATEIGYMNQVYKNATVTIAAASASNVQDGFLGRKSRPTGIQVNFPCPDGQLGTVYLVRKHEYMENALGPLYHRAWALQERVLSPRLLIFGKWELVWQCHQVHNAQVTASHLTLEQVEDSIRLPTGIYYRHSGVLAEKTGFDLHLWKRIVEEYSACQLTLPEDKLPALAGIVSELARVWNMSSYYAGLWKHQFIKQMCWYRDEEENGRVNIGSKSSIQNTVVNRKVVYRAPIWSWASIDGQVRYGIFIRSIEVASLVNCYVEPSSLQAAFGQVKNGQVNINGNMAILKVFGVDWFTTTIIDANGSTFQDYLASYDKEQIKLKEQTIWVVLLTAPDLELNSRLLAPMEGLILQTVGNSGTQFKRIGYWKTEGSQKRGTNRDRGAVGNHVNQNRVKVDFFYASSECRTISII